MFEIELFICIKMDLALNNRQWLICHKTKPNFHFFFCIWSCQIKITSEQFYVTQTDTITLGQSGPEDNDNECQLRVILRIPLFEAVGLTPLQKGTVSIF